MSTNERVTLVNEGGTKKVTTSDSGSKTGLDVNLLQGLSSELSEYAFSDLNESDVVYNYYGYLKSDGGWFILRLPKDNTEARYSSGLSDYTTSWTNRTSLTYQLYSEEF